MGDSHQNKEGLRSFFRLQGQSAYIILIRPISRLFTLNVLVQKMRQVIDHPLTSDDLNLVIQSKVGC